MRITDMLVCVGWAFFLFVASTWIPFIGPLFSLLVPLPFLYYSIKLGFYQGVKLAALATLIIGFFFNVAGHPHIILFSLELSLLGLCLSWLFSRKLNLGQTVFFATLFMLLLNFGYLFIIALSKNKGPLEMILDFLQSQLTVTIRAYEGMGIPHEKSSDIEVYLKAFIDTISKIYPSLMIIGAGFAVWLNVVIAKPLFRVGDLEYPEFVPMDRWQAPDYLVWVVIVAGFALFLFSGGIKLLAINTLIVLLAVYFFHGLSIALFFFNKYHVPSWIRIGAYFLIVFQQLFGAILAIAGLFDQWIDFRKIHRRMDS